MKEINQQEAIELLKSEKKGVFLDLEYDDITGHQHHSYFINSKGELVSFSSDEKQLKMLEQDDDFCFCASIGLKLDSGEATCVPFDNAIPVIDTKNHINFDIKHKLVDLY